jgi:alkylation response protein AidB-like acyl-CoA dehydrogenase
MHDAQPSGADMSQTTTSRDDAIDIDTYRQQARTWLQANLVRRSGPAPRQREIGYFTPEVMAANRALQLKLYEGGYAGITWPKEYGGQGLPPAYEEAFLTEAEDYETPEFGALSGTTFGVCVPTMLAHGSPEFLRDFVPKVMRGEALVCQFFSEPASGSDLAGSRTRATPDGDIWRLNGQKIWSTFAHLADWGLCLARSNWDVPKHRGLTWFAVDCQSPGLEIRPIKRLNESAEFCQEFFDDVIVPDSRRIGDVNGGWAIAQTTMLVRERGGGRSVGNAALAGPGALAPDLVELVNSVGKAADPVARQKVARAHCIDFVGRALVYRLARMGAKDGATPQMAAYGKLFMGTYNPIRARLGVEIGGAGAMAWGRSDGRTSVTSNTYLNGRISSIAGGTNEMQRNGISERTLGLPREPSYDTNKPFSQVIHDAQSWTGSA